MSWAVEEWKEGLSPRVLQKIHELENKVDKLKKERQQRQFQLECLEVALQEQKQKVCLHLFIIRKRNYFIVMPVKTASEQK
uniref:Centromere protein Cenp-F N-terminal domain-containing protein n=1 Tax=Calidris pygmaea TaxID=425635 RepID=A0A8C3KRU6_9CHAR